MGRWVLLLSLLGACGESRGMSGDWSYTWAIQGQQLLHGSVDFQQSGDRLTGNIALPADYDPTQIDPAVWDWRLDGTVTDAQITPGPGCACDAQPFVLRCGATDDAIACQVTQHDEFGDHGGSFVATR